MSRYDWIKAPTWAKAAATDKDGRRSWHNCVPTRGAVIWFGGLVSPIPCDDWAGSLELRPARTEAKWESESRVNIGAKP